MMLNRNQVEAAITTLEASGDVMDHSVINLSITALQQQLDRLTQQEAQDVALRGERKQVTIMFADISGFTAMSEKLDPEEVRNLINACFAQLGAVINYYDGYIDKFIGDEIMALFGAPKAHENDPERAVRTALDMMATLAEFNEQYADRLLQPLALHFGINTGLVIAGGIGTENRQDYSVMGDAVNLAARLEDLSEAGEILVGEMTYRLTAPLFEFDPLAPVQMKGKENSVQIYRVLKATALRGQIRSLKGLRSRFVGRQTELSTLCTTMAQLQQGQGGLISILGEAGLGKSCLVREAQLAAQDRGSIWAKGLALSYGQQASFLIIRDIFRNLFNLSTEDSPHQFADILRAEIKHYFAEQWLDLYPYLAYLLEIPLLADEAERVKYLQGDALNMQIFQSVQTYISAKSKVAPLVLVWDDLHWIDPSSLNLLQALLPLVHQHPILHILVYRPMYSSRIWAVHEKLQQQAELKKQSYHCISLSSLSLAESQTLVSNLMGQDPRGQTLQELIVQKSEGNPFFVEEVLRSLLDNGTLIRTKSDQSSLIPTMDITEITIPDTLQGVITARIDQLDPQTKRTLQIASVIGRVFPRQVLAQVVSNLKI